MACPALIPQTNLPITTISGAPTLFAYVPHGSLTGLQQFTFTPHDGAAGQTIVRVYINGAAHCDDAFTPTIWSGCVSVGSSKTATVDVTANSYPFYQVFITYCDGVGFAGLLDIAGPTTPSAFCAYGVQANPDATVYQLITDGLIDLVVAAALAGTANAEWIPYVETFLGAIEGGVWLGVNCATMPSGSTSLDLSNPATISRENLLGWFQNAAWQFFCQCVPAPSGSPDPVPPPPPDVTPPTGLSPTQPTFVCDNEDLCTFLTGIKTELQQLLAQVSYLRSDVRLIQRQKVPFAYLAGTLHSGLSGAGQFAVQGILGLAVQVTTVPGASGEEAGDPIARFGLGWVTTGTANGWRKSVPIRANPQWVDVEPDDTLVGYSLEPLVVANIQEFAREP